MNGPDHYAAAERHLDNAQQAETGSDVERYYLSAAQAHAALALAAATVANIRRNGPVPTDGSEWESVIQQ